MRDNKLLSRKELEVVAHHPGMACPSKEEVRDKISELYQTNKKNIVIAGMNNRYGTHRSMMNARIYASADMLTQIEKKNIVAKMTRTEIKIKARRVRKDERKKSYKMFGTLRRNTRKAEKRSNK
ncbi:hypothetical protein OCOL_000063 [Ordospora colligata]